MALTADQENRARDLWENSDLPVREIAESLGVTKNIVMGVAHRRGWSPRGERLISDGPVRTLFDRMDALHAAMDLVLAETELAIRSYLG